MIRRTFLLSGFGLAVAAMVPPLRASAQGVTAAPAYILGATAITKVFGAGQRLVGVAIQQDRPVDAAALDPTLYSVEGRAITKVYASASPQPGVEDASGNWIVLDLSPDDATASLFVTDGRDTKRLPAATTVTITPKTAAAADGAQSGPPDFNNIPRSIPTDAAVNLVVDDFVQGEFHDEVTGDTLAYNLYEPKDRDPAKPLPLVLFMHDAGNTSPVTDTTLVQGLGAVSWAGPEDQAKHPALVLAPQYAAQTVDDSSNATSLLDTTLHLLDHIAKTHNVDAKRIYTTGQSGGGMMSIAMLVKEPDLFAAAFLVACQWDPVVVQPLAKQKLWVVVSEGDEKAFPGQNAIMKVIEAEGTPHSEAVWDGRSDAATFAKAVADQAALGRTVNYSVLKKGTVVPTGQDDNPGSNHVNTWRIAYAIPGIRDWILQQVKAS
jgi:predicted peptidase